MSTRSASIVSALSTLALGACIVEDFDTGHVDQAVGGTCRPWHCGANSPKIDDHGTHHFDETGGELDGFKIVKTQKAGVDYSLNIKGDRMTARRVSWPFTTLTGLASDCPGAACIEGLQLFVQYGGTDTYIIEVKDVGGYLAYWADSGSGSTATIPTYRLEWTEAPGWVSLQEWENVCSEPPGDNGEPTFGMNDQESLVFEGDLIDADKKTVDGFDKRIFNIGCAGHALAKMHLTGHTTAAKSGGFTPTRLEMQTNLKMLVANYCGNGDAFTVAGEPLDWTDKYGWMQYWSANPKLEARWNADGATCLTTPRLADTTNPLAAIAFPLGVDDAIDSICGQRRPPVCGNDDPYDLDGTHLVSSNPSEP
jgi:hypothetical protein